MKEEKTVTINGRKYDKNTGLPIGNAPSKQSKVDEKSIKTPKIVHSIANKSKALYSHASMKTFNDIQGPIRKVARNMDIAKSKHVTRFAPSAALSVKKQPAKGVTLDVKPTKHPIAAKVQKARAQVKSKQTAKPTEKTPKTIKQEAIDEAINNAVKPTETKNGFFKRHRKYINAFTIGAAVLIIVGYFVYLNMPAISVRVASFQSGIDASFPQYHPDGYRVDGPVSYSDGEVLINFRSNSDNTRFVIKQSKSSWDSSALKIQVDKDSGNNTLESQEGGLTIYSYNDNSKAAWVNGGILYTIDGDAKLSGEQIRHIATSL